LAEVNPVSENLYLLARRPPMEVIAGKEREHI
jgi:hypothetical protein